MWEEHTTSLSNWALFRLPQIETEFGLSFSFASWRYPHHTNSWTCHNGYVALMKTQATIILSHQSSIPLPGVPHLCSPEQQLQLGTAYPGNLEMQVLRPHPRPAELNTLWVGSSNLCFKELLGDPNALKFENHHSTPCLAKCLCPMAVATITRSPKPC